MGAIELRASFLFRPAVDVLAIVDTGTAPAGGTKHHPLASVVMSKTGARQKKQAQAIPLQAKRDLVDAKKDSASALPLSATPCIRIRYGDRQSKASAQLLVTRMQEEFGDEVRVVLRRNHDDQDSPRVVVGFEFFGVSMQLSEPALWSSQPQDGDEQKEWMDPPVRTMRATSTHGPCARSTACAARF